jgi:uncharacterized repeat protein (TIGR01451 family)
MSHKKTSIKSCSARAISLALIGVAGLWMGVWLLSVPPSDASGVLPELTFQSIIPTPPVNDPYLSLVKSVDNDVPSPGEEIEYTLTYSTTNPGSQAFNVRLYDFLPAGVQFVSANPSASHNDGVVLFTDSSAGPANETATVRVLVKEGYEQLYNHAMLMADLVYPAQASLLIDVEQPSAWLGLSKAGYHAVLASTELLYTLRCENPGDITVNNVTVKDVLPTGVTFVDASPSPDPGGTLPVLMWSLGDLGSGESRIIVITTTSPALTGVITNVAMADAQQRVMTHTLFASQVVTKGAILKVTKQGSPSVVDVGDKLVYTLQYENIGNETATGVVLTDTLPDDVTVTGIYSSATLIMTDPLVWNLGTILTDTPPGEVVITVTVGGNWDRILHNEASITAASGFPDDAELDTTVRSAMLYLPIVMRNF